MKKYSKPNNSQHRQQSIQKITGMGGLIDAILGAIKILVGYLVHSPALVADGFHSLSDLATDIAVVLFSHWAQPAPDANHPYGHHRYETLGTVLLGSSLVVVAAFIAWNSVSLFFDQAHQPQASLIAIVVAAISIVSKEWVFRFTKNAATRLKSKLLEANAWHSRSDALSSLVVLLGVVATWFGYPWVELIAAMIVAVMIGKMGVKLSWNASQDLIDRGMDPEESNRVQQSIRATPGVLDVHMLRTRMMAHHVYLDVHIQVGARVTVSEGHFIAEQVSHAVKQGHDAIADITVHVDYEEDLDESQTGAPTIVTATTTTTTKLPQRAFLEAELAKLRIYPDTLQIHYIANKVILELFFATEPVDLQGLKISLNKWTEQQDCLGESVIYIAAK